HLTHARVDRSQRVLDVRDEGAAADLRSVDVAGTDAQVLGRLRSHPQAGAEDRVDVVLPEPGVGERVSRRLGVELEGGLVGQLPVLVGFVGADDRDAPAQAAEVALGAHAGRKWGSAISDDTSSNTTSTGIPIRIFAGSASMPTRFDMRRAPSSSSTIAMTYGVPRGKSRWPRCT